MKGAIAVFVFLVIVWLLCAIFEAVSYYIPVWLMFLAIPALFAYAIWETRDIEKKNKDDN